MPEFIEAGVRKMQDASSSERVALLLGARDESARDGLSDQLDDIGAENVEDVGKSSLRVTVTAEDIDILCGWDNVVSIELDQEDVYLQGNL